MYGAVVPPSVGSMTAEEQGAIVAAERLQTKLGSNLWHPVRKPQPLLSFEVCHYLSDNFTQTSRRLALILSLTWVVNMLSRGVIIFHLHSYRLSGSVVLQPWHDTHGRGTITQLLLKVML